MIEIYTDGGQIASVLAPIAAECFSHPWSERSFAQSENTVFFVCFEGGEAAGYLALIKNGREADIASLAVKKACRRRGVGRSLVDSAVKYCDGLDAITLEVRQSNTAAQSLYEGFGFCRVGLRPNFYRDPKEDAVLMTLFLNE